MKGIRISQHALLRWAQRIDGLDLEKLEKDIEKALCEHKNTIKAFKGNLEVPINGTPNAFVILENYVAVTVLIRTNVPKPRILRKKY